MKKTNAALLILALALSTNAFAAQERGRDRSAEEKASDAKSGEGAKKEAEGKASLEALFGKDADTVRELRAIEKQGGAKEAAVKAANALAEVVSLKEGETLKASDILTAVKSYDAADLAGFTKYLGKAADIAKAAAKGAEGQAISIDEAWKQALDVKVKYDNEEMKLIDAWLKCMKRKFPGA